MTWEGELSADGRRFDGASSGTETIRAEFPAFGEMDVPFDYEISFGTELTE